MKGLRLAAILDTSLPARSDISRLGDRLAEAVGEDGALLRYGDADSLDVALDTVIEEGYDLLGVAGEDATLSSVLARLLQRGDLPEGLRYLPLPVGGQNIVARDLDIQGDALAVAGRITKLRRRGPGLLRSPARDAPRRLLRVVDSARPEPRFGFTLGLGGLAELFTAPADGKRSLSSVVKSTFGNVAEELLAGDDAQTAARIAVDREPFAEKLAFAAASTLGRLPLGMRPFAELSARQKQIHFLWGERATAITSLLATPLTRRKLSGERYQTRKTRRVDISLDGDYALDGAVAEGEGPYALALRPGPIVPLLSV